MTIDDSSLPPKWVKVFSWLFMIFLIMPSILILQIYNSGTPIGVSAFGLKLEGGKDPSAWILAVSGVLFLAALTGLFIVTKRSFAYSFGLFYCVVTLGVTIPGHFFVGDWDESTSISILIQYCLLIAFLVHLIRNRNAWKNQNVKKAE